MVEVWKDIPNYEGFYQASSFGRIKSFHRHKKGKILKPATDAIGRKQVCLVKNSVHKHMRVHRLVMLAFIPNPLNKATVNHKDGNPSNNYLTNLEWATLSENIQHAYDNNLNFRYNLNIDDLKHKHYVDKMNIQDIAKLYEIDRCVIERHFKQNNLKIIKRRNDIDWETLFNDGIRNIDIRNDYNVSLSTIKYNKRKWRKQYE